MPSTITMIAPLGLLAAITAGCTTFGDVPTQRIGTASLSLLNGMPAGRVELISNGQNLSLAIAATGIPEGSHGFHFHQTGKCQTPNFTSAGGHLNPAGAEHGTMNPDGSHLGDLPNLEVGASRTITRNIDLTGNRPESRSTILDNIFDGDGTAIMIHAGPDDYRTDPSGDAGSRIACGVLQRA